jgi:hypothetical protein
MPLLRQVFTLLMDTPILPVTPHLTILSNIGTTYQDPGAPEPGNKWGVLSTATDITWWYAPAATGVYVANGHPDFTGYSAPYDPRTMLFSEHQCWLIMGTSVFPQIIDSIKVWQSAPPSAIPAAGGFRGLRGRH